MRKHSLRLLIVGVIVATVPAWAEPVRPVAKPARFRTPAAKDVRSARGAMKVKLRAGTHQFEVAPGQHIDIVVEEGTTARVAFAAAPGLVGGAARVKLSKAIKVKNGVGAGAGMLQNGLLRTAGRLAGVAKPSISVREFKLSLSSEDGEPMILAETKGRMGLFGVNAIPMIPPLKVPVRALKPILENLDPSTPDPAGLRTLASQALGMAEDASGIVTGMVDLSNPLEPGRTTPVEFRANFAAQPSPKGLTLTTGELKLDGFGIRGTFRAVGEIEIK